MELNEAPQNLIAPKDLLERALASPKGIRVWFKTSADAISMRNRMSAVKTKDRKKSTQIYEFSSPLYNKSSYDSLAVIIKPGIYSRSEELTKILSLPPEEIWTGVWMYILPEGTSDSGFIVEELS